jgi:hypothetical protein
LTPESIMAAFETPGPLPRAALRAAGESREAMVPIFLDYIDRLFELDVESVPEDHAFTFVYHLLSEWGETRAYRPMARLLRRDPAFVDDLMGDGITECTARVMASLFDGELEPILDAIRDEDAEPFVRGQMLDALVILALDRPLLKPDVGEFLRAFHAVAREATTPDVVWSSWAFAIAALGLTDMAPLVRRVYGDGLIDPLDSDFAFFEESLRETLEAGRPKWFRKVGDRGRIVDTVTELSRWYCFSESFLRSERKRELLDDSSPLASELTSAHVRPKVGRNDPCPCGSGTKFKKCCLS